MMRCYLLDGDFKDSEVPLEEIESVTRNNWQYLRNMPIDDIVQVMDELGRQLVKDPSCRTLEGVSYISLWLRRSNVERMLREELGDPKVLDSFTEIEGTQMRAHPRGIVNHWVANNVVTLGAFSMFMAIFSKNASILKASKVNKDHLLKILNKLSSIRIEKEGRVLSGENIVKAVSVVTFEGKDHDSSSHFSMVADCKIIWGGAESVLAISSLPQREGCEVLVFGPKYSLAVMDRDFASQKDLGKDLQAFAKDVALFNQMACSSPQVLFIERGGRPVNDIASELSASFEALRKSVIGEPIPEELCGRIINARGQYLLTPEYELLTPEDLAWTILIDGGTEFPEPVHGRCIFLREFDDISQITEQMTKNVQAVELLFLDHEKKMKFAEMATASGADRIVSPGGSHDFALPWDGLKPLSRLVRWVTCK